jgi:hypothetical protein
MECARDARLGRRRFSKPRFHEASTPRAHWSGCLMPTVIPHLRGPTGALAFRLARRRHPPSTRGFSLVRFRWLSTVRPPVLFHLCHRLPEKATLHTPRLARKIRRQNASDEISLPANEFTLRKVWPLQRSLPHMDIEMHSVHRSRCRHWGRVFLSRAVSISAFSMRRGCRLAVHISSKAGLRPR